MVDDRLDRSEEHVIWEGRPSWRGYVLFIAFALAVPFVVGEHFGYYYGLLGGASIVAVCGVHRMRLRYQITNQRIVSTKGIIAKSTAEAEIADIKVINVIQGIVQVILGIGKIEFTTASGPLKEVELVNVEEPEELKETIRTCRSRLLSGEPAAAEGTLPFGGNGPESPAGEVAPRRPGPGRRRIGE